MIDVVRSSKCLGTRATSKLVLAPCEPGIRLEMRVRSVTAALLIKRSSDISTYSQITTAFVRIGLYNSEY